MNDTNRLLMIILCVVIPPFAVFVSKGFGKDFIINLILTLIFFVPGMIHALWLTLK
ncbi:YqaE/Pmp3 family membrane protein [Vibrio sp. SCSIO 43135]|uniref:YqaE/Pmp3 family membrane protein n=1 Tax=Vibrio paucivorans TaxID=2829489 RepID=A0A9X3CDG7_9VIBR|nr:MULTISPECIES: YqaE/Pmp3 family membrane protein [Vibrio]MCW8333726.1 YqaE/Pmp3 family membrane protein [Vibrio paucivorans]USD43908.1 YqaE/Pmp3 family membrane protein [Vibrio sp. SCSIO 43135]